MHTLHSSVSCKLCAHTHTFCLLQPVRTHTHYTVVSPATYVHTHTLHSSVFWNLCAHIHTIQFSLLQPVCVHTHTPIHYAVLSPATHVHTYTLHIYVSYNPSTHYTVPSPATSRNWTWDWQIIVPLQATRVNPNSAEFSSLMTHSGGTAEWDDCGQKWGSPLCLLTQKEFSHGAQWLWDWFQCLQIQRRVSFPKPLQLPASVLLQTPQTYQLPWKVLVFGEFIRDNEMAVL